MVNSKHTPGPWAFTDAMYGIDNMRVNGVIDAAGNGVANCGFDYGNRRESIANAQLIAAAPDMLAALEQAAYVDDLVKEIAALIDGKGPTKAQLDDLDWQRIKRDEMRAAAIAKAKGGAT